MFRIYDKHGIFYKLNWRCFWFPPKFVSSPPFVFLFFIQCNVILLEKFENLIKSLLGKNTYKKK